MREIIAIISNIFILILGFLIVKFNLVEILAGYDKDKVKDSTGFARFVGCNLILIGLLNIAIASTLKIAKVQVEDNALIYVVVTLLLVTRIVLGSRKFEN